MMTKTATHKNQQYKLYLITIFCTFVWRTQAAQPQPVNNSGEHGQHTRFAYRKLNYRRIEIII